MIGYNQDLKNINYLTYLAGGSRKFVRLLILANNQNRGSQLSEFSVELIRYIINTPKCLTQNYSTI